MGLSLKSLLTSPSLSFCPDRDLLKRPDQLFCRRSILDWNVCFLVAMFPCSSNPCVTWGLVGLRGLGRLGHQGSTADDLREAGIRDGPWSLLSNKSDADMGRRRGVKMNPVAFQCTKDVQVGRWISEPGDAIVSC